LRKRAISLVWMVVLMLSISAQAIQPKNSSASPTLVFNGTTAICSVMCRGNSTTDDIDATLTLYQGSIVVDSWYASGKYRINISDSCTVQSGKMYTLTVEYAVNNVDMPAVSTTKRCP
jgi:hypothetical protein